MCGGSSSVSRWRAKWNGLRPSVERLHAVGGAGADHHEAAVGGHGLLAVTGAFAGPHGSDVEHVGVEVQGRLSPCHSAVPHADAEAALRPAVDEVVVGRTREVADPHLVVVGQDAEPRRDVVEVLVVGAGHAAGGC